VDVWGYRTPAATSPDSTGRGPVQSAAGLVGAPLLAVADAPAGHPYAAIGADAVRDGLAFVRELAGGLLAGDENQNVLLPTAAGAVRPTCLAQPSMLAGRCVDGAKFAIVGLKRLKDFHPALVAGNLARAVLPGGGRLRARPLMVDVPAREGEADSSALTYARAFDTPGFPLLLAAAIRPLLEDDETVGLPAMLGTRPDGWHALEEQLGHPVFEIPLPPPSVPGLRLNDALTTAAKDAGVRFVLGSFVHDVHAGAGHVVSVSIDSTGHPHEFLADAFVLATGGFESGALTIDSSGTLTESVFGLPVTAVGSPFGDELWAPHALFAQGVRVDASMRALNGGGVPVYDNLYVAGGLLGGAQRWQEKSGEGIALGSAIKAAGSIAAAPRAPDGKGLA